MSQAELMHKIVALQLFDGSYNLDTTLCSALNLNHSLLSQRASSNGWDTKAFAVTLVLAFFRDKLDSLQDDWELIADKARIWLLSNAASKADEMFEAAVKAVNAM